IEDINKLICKVLSGWREVRPEVAKDTISLSLIVRHVSK
ncbi:hypothetical protein CEXT_499711, partial [Caerostris extrusa]